MSELHKILDPDGNPDHPDTLIKLFLVGHPSYPEKFIKSVINKKIDELDKQCLLGGSNDKIILEDLLLLLLPTD